MGRNRKCEWDWLLDSCLSVKGSGLAWGWLPADLGFQAAGRYNSRTARSMAILPSTPRGPALMGFSWSTWCPNILGKRASRPQGISYLHRPGWDTDHRKEENISERHSCSEVKLGWGPMALQSWFCFAFFFPPSHFNFLYTVLEFSILFHLSHPSPVQPKLAFIHSTSFSSNNFHLHSVTERDLIGSK